MSHWDFSRRPEADHDAPPSGPDGTAYEPDLTLGTYDARTARYALRPGGARGLRPDGDGTPRTPSPTGNTGPAAAHWPAGEGWPPRRGESPGEGRPSGDAWDGDAWGGDEGTAPYPITYERDDFLAAAPEPAPPPAAPWEPWPAADSYPPGEIPAAWDGADGGWDGEGRRSAGRGGRRWLVLAVVAVAGAAVGAAAVLLAGPGPAGRSGQPAGASAAPPATPAAQHSAAASSSAAPRPSSLLLLRPGALPGRADLPGAVRRLRPARGRRRARRRRRLPGHHRQGLGAPAAQPHHRMSRPPYRPAGRGI